MFCWRFSIYSLSLFIRYILINERACAAFHREWNYGDLWTGTAAWSVRGWLDPEGVRFGPSQVQVRGRPTPGPGGPRQQVGGVGLPPDRHPPEVVATLAAHGAGFACGPEVVATLAAHGAGFARGSALSPALGRTRMSARRGPQWQPDPRGSRLHAHARRDSRGVTPAAPWPVLPRPCLPGRAVGHPVSAAPRLT